MSLSDLGQVGGGLMPDPQSVRGKEADERPFYPQATRLMFVDAAETIVRPIGRILRQPRFPCCTGQGIAGGIDWRLLRDNRRHPRTSERVWVSGVSVWREARRRARGTVADITVGAYAWAALDGVAHRGWDPWRSGEDTDTEEAGAGAPPAFEIGCMVEGSGVSIRGADGTVAPLAGLGYDHFSGDFSGEGCGEGGRVGR